MRSEEEKATTDSSFRPEKWNPAAEERYVQKSGLPSLNAAKDRAMLNAQFGL